MDVDSVINLQAEEHDVIDDSTFISAEQHVLHQMHLADYRRAVQIVQGKVGLDLGCNSGYGTHLLSLACNQITGVDVSSAAVEKAERDYRRENLRFQVTNGSTLPFGRHAFDFVTSFQVIEHIVDYEAFFGEIRRVLKPNGVLLLTTPNAAIRVRPGEKPWNRFHNREFTGDELSELLLEHFAHVTVLGQFATEEAYWIEYRRCVAQRDRPHGSKTETIKRKIMKAAPRQFTGVLRTLRYHFTKAKAKRAAQEAKARFSVEDFFYLDEELDRSLSLFAISSNVTLLDATRVNGYEYRCWPVLSKQK